ncbi:MAG: 3-deoxy-manno-octulosonate cytidylyltransferase [Desulfobacterales bacterium]|nr:3-deoxy-manno-octulosonate cytidylyltransferase [Desulfobacterales bacterium]
MNKNLKCYGIIPARYASTRFPGKPLSEILGKPMFWHVFQRSRKCRELSQVVLATDSNLIFAAAKKLAVPVVMTRDDHPSGTDRVLEAAKIIQVEADAIVVNIQGDEPTLNPVMLTELIAPFKDPQVQVTTLARKIDLKEAENSDQVKVVFSKSGRALYFSRFAIPFCRDGKNDDFYGHIGLYAFRMKTLEQFCACKPSRLEQIEKLEQLRLLENDIPIQVVETEHRSVGVDRPEDLKFVTQILLDEKLGNP